jgi:hypothetical protein
MKISINKYEAQRAIEKIIDEQLILMDKINNSSAYSKDECENKIRMINKRDTYDYVLKLFGIQSFEYTKDEFNTIDID